MSGSPTRIKKISLALLAIVLVAAIAVSGYYGDDYHISVTSTCEPADREAQMRAFLNGRNYWVNQRKLVENQIIFLSPESTAQMEAISKSVLEPYPALRDSVAAGQGARSAERTARFRDLVTLYSACKAKRPEWTEK